MFSFENFKKSRLYQDIYREGKLEGLERGLKRGLIRGLEKGREEAKLQMVDVLLRRGFFVEEIAEIVQLDVKRVRERLGVR